MKRIFLILQYSALKSMVVQYNSWHTGLALSEQVRSITDLRRGRRREMVELKDHQQ